MNVTKNNNNNLYMIIPNDYSCVYNKLLKLLSNLGSNMLDDCKSSCSSTSKNLMNCWTMFQTACAAYYIGEIKKADTIIKYINAQLNLGCINIARPELKIIYFGDSNEEPSILDIISGDNINFIETPIFEASFYNLLNYIAVPKGVIISTIKNANFGGDYLYNEATGEDLYTRRVITLNNKQYLLWECKYLQPLNSNIIINAREGNWDISNILYYNVINTEPNISDIDINKNIDLSTTNKFNIFVDDIVHFILIPDSYKIHTIENASFRGDYLYNEQLNIDLYIKNNIVYNGYKYSLWYNKFAQPLNGNIEVILK